MNDDKHFERAVDVWLDAGSDRTPPPAIEAVLLAIRTTPQERDLGVPWRTPTMSNPLRFVAAIAVIAVVGALGLNFLREPAVGVAPTPTPTVTPEPTATPPASASPDALVDTSTWTAYTSDQYGFTLAYPAGWDVQPATRAWTVEADALLPAIQDTAASDHFVDPGTVIVSIWAVPIEADSIQTWSELATWASGFCADIELLRCSTVRDVAIPMCNEERDCHETALLVPYDVVDSTVQAYVVMGDDADKVVVVSAWRGQNHPALAKFGGGRALIEAFLETMNVVPAPIDHLPPA